MPTAPPPSRGGGGLWGKKKWHHTFSNSNNSVWNRTKVGHCRDGNIDIKWSNWPIDWTGEFSSKIQFHLFLEIVYQVFRHLWLWDWRLRLFVIQYAKHTLSIWQPLKLNVKRLNNNNNNNNNKFCWFSFKKLFLNNKFNIYLGAFEIQRHISQWWNPFFMFLDFTFYCKSEIPILKSKSRFPNQPHP